jgi:hypothetical protein
LDSAEPENETVDILRAVFRLEAERTMQLARLGRALGAEEALDDVDERLAGAITALDRRGVAYPLHAIARRYRLSQEDYLVLQLALLPRHGPDVVRVTTESLGEPTLRPHLSHALALIAEGYDDWAASRAELVTFPVFKEKLVSLEPPHAEDPELHPSLAILELLGLE